MFLSVETYHYFMQHAEKFVLTEEIFNVIKRISIGLQREILLLNGYIYTRGTYKQVTFYSYFSISSQHLVFMHRTFQIA